MSEKNEEPKSLQREIFEWVVCIVVAFVLALFIKYFIFTPTLVMQKSMTPTILNNERVFVNRLVRTFNLSLNHGDIVTFEAPVYDEGIRDAIQNGELKATYSERTGIFDSFTYNVMEIGKISYIKRVIALSGDRVQFIDGEVYVNGEKLDEEYLPSKTKTILKSFEISNDFVVPEGYVFCMGDNRGNSQDCRDFGCIPKSKIEGRVVGRIWPLDKFGGIGPAEDKEDYNGKL